MIEGVFGELAQVALSRATVLVWLDLSWGECRRGLLQRGLHYGYDPADPVDLAALTEAHSQYEYGASEALRRFRRA